MRMPPRPADDLTWFAGSMSLIALVALAVFIAAIVP
jgi:hypothetical protein